MMMMMMMNKQIINVRYEILVKVQADVA